MEKALALELQDVSSSPGASITCSLQALLSSYRKVDTIMPVLLTAQVYCALQVRECL